MRLISAETSSTHGKMIFGTDWPGVPGLENNALALFDLGLDTKTVELILHENARQVYGLDADQERKDAAPG